MATGDSLDEIKRLMREGIAFHLEAIGDDGLPVPEPLNLMELIK